MKDTAINNIKKYNELRSKIAKKALCGTEYKIKGRGGVFHLNQNRPSLVPVTLGTGTGKTTMVMEFSIEELALMEKEGDFGTSFFVVQKVMQAKEIPNDSYIMKSARKNRIPLLHNPAIDDFIDSSVDVFSVITSSQFHSHSPKEDGYGECSPINLDTLISEMMRTKYKDGNVNIDKKIDKVIKDYYSNGFSESEDDDENENVDQNSNNFKLSKFKEIIDIIVEKGKKLENDNLSDLERNNIKKEIAYNKIIAGGIRRKITQAILSSKCGIYGDEDKYGNIRQDKNLPPIIEYEEGIEDNLLVNNHNEIMYFYRKKALSLKNSVYDKKDIFKLENDKLVLGDGFSNLKIQEILWIILSVIDPSGIAQFTNSIVFMTHSKYSQRAPISGISRNGKYTQYNIYGTVNHISPHENYSSVVDAISENNVKKMVCSNVSIENLNDALFPIGEKEPKVKLIIDEYPTFDSSGGAGKDVTCIEVMEEINNDDNVKYGAEAIIKYKKIRDNDCEVIDIYRKQFYSKKPIKNIVEKNYWNDLIEYAIPIVSYERYIKPILRNCIIKEFFQSGLIKIRLSNGEVLFPVNGDKEKVDNAYMTFEKAAEYGWGGASSRSDISFGRVTRNEDNEILISIKDETSKKLYVKENYDVIKSLETINKTTPYPNNLGTETGSKIGVLISYKAPCVMKIEDIVDICSDEKIKEDIRNGVPSEFKATFRTDGMDDRLKERSLFYVPFSLIGAFFAVGVVEPCLLAMAVENKRISRNTLRNKINKDSNQKNATMYKFAQKLCNGKKHEYILKSLEYIYDPKFLFNDDDPVTLLQGHGLPLLLVGFSATTPEYDLNTTINPILGIKVNVHIRFMSTQLNVYSMSIIPGMQVVLLSATMGYRDCREGEIIDVYKKFNVEGYPEKEQKNPNDGIHILSKKTKKEIMEHKEKMEELSLGKGSNPVVISSRKTYCKEDDYRETKQNNVKFSKTSWASHETQCDKKFNIKSTKVFDKNNKDVINFMNNGFLNRINTTYNIEDKSFFDANNYGIFISKKNDNELFSGEFDGKNARSIQNLGSLNFIDYTSAKKGTVSYNIINGILNEISGNHHNKVDEMISAMNELYISSGKAAASLIISRSGNPGKYIVNCALSVCMKLTGIDPDSKDFLTHLKGGDREQRVKKIKELWDKNKQGIIDSVAFCESIYNRVFLNSESSSEERYDAERAFVSARALYRMAENYVYNTIMSAKDHGDIKMFRDAAKISVAVPVELFSYKNKTESDKIYRENGPIILINFAAKVAKNLNKKRDIFRIYSKKDDIDELSNFSSISCEKIIPILFTAYKSGGEAFNLMVGDKFTYKRLCLINSPYYSDLSVIIDYIKTRNDGDKKQQINGIKYEKILSSRETAIIADCVGRYCGENNLDRNVLRGEVDSLEMLEFLETEHALNVLKIIFQATGRGERSIRNCETEISISNNIINYSCGFFDELMRYLFIYIQKEIGNGHDVNHMLHGNNFYGTSLFTKALIITCAKVYRGNILAWREHGNEVTDEKIKDEKEKFIKNSEVISDSDEFIYGKSFNQNGESYIKGLIVEARGNDDGNPNVIAAILSSIIRVDLIDNLKMIPSFNEVRRQIGQNEYPTIFMRMILGAIDANPRSYELKEFINDQIALIGDSESYLYPDSILDTIKESMRASAFLSYYKNGRDNIMESKLITDKKSGKRYRVFAPFGLFNGNLYVNKLSEDLLIMKKSFENIIGSKESELTDPLRNAVQIIDKIVDNSFTDFTGVGQASCIKGTIAENIVREITNRKRMKRYGFEPLEVMDNSFRKIKIGNYAVQDEEFIASIYEIGDRLFYNPDKNRLISLDVKNFSSHKSYLRFCVSEESAARKEKILKRIMERFLEEHGAALCVNNKVELSVKYQMVNVNPSSVSINSDWDRCPSLYGRVAPRLVKGENESKRMNVKEKEGFEINPSFLNVFKLS